MPNAPGTGMSPDDMVLSEDLRKASVVVVDTGRKPAEAPASALPACSCACLVLASALASAPPCGPFWLVLGHCRSMSVAESDTRGGSSLVRHHSYIGDPLIQSKVFCLVQQQ